MSKNQINCSSTGNTTTDISMYDNCDGSLDLISSPREVYWGFVGVYCGKYEIL